MASWVDINEGEWFYNEVMEASEVTLEDGSPFIEGIAYNLFEDGAPYVYEEQTGSTGKKVFALSQRVVPTADNPLYVFVDGVQSIYKNITKNEAGTTDVELYAAPRAGAVVSFVSIGKPKVDRFGKPLALQEYAYPVYTLSAGPGYHYDAFSRKYQEYVYAFGRQLKRASVLDSDWVEMNWTDVGKKYIGTKTDVYCVAPNGLILMPFNLNEVSCTIVYSYYDASGFVKQKTEQFKPSSASVAFTNRFFPDAYITRAEAFVLLDRLRQTFYSRFTDTKAPGNKLEQTIIASEGQTVFKLNNKYPCKKRLLLVKVNGITQDVFGDYDEVNEYTVRFEKPLHKGDEVYFYYEKNSSTRFGDVGVDSSLIDITDEGVLDIDGDIGTSWWASYILTMEDETLDDGLYLIEGMDIDNFDESGRIVVDDMYNPIAGVDEVQKMFMPQTLMTRAQAVTILNRFRKWSMERFKL